jgi:CBS domain containing-hemolysin-like protein
MSGALTLGLILLCLACSGYFSGAETALLSVSRVRIRHRMETGDARAAISWTLLQAPETLFMAMLLAVNICNVAATVLATNYLVSLAIPGAETVSTVVMTPVILLLAEILPKAVGRAVSLPYTLFSARILDLTQVLLAPVVFLVDGATSILMRLLGVSASGREQTVTREEIKSFLESEGGESPRYRKMIRGAWSFARTTVREVMIPLTRVSAVSTEETMRGALELSRSSGFARVPVYRERIDNVIGVLHLGELVFETQLDLDAPVESYLRAPLYLPNTLASEKAIYRLQEARETIAVVIDEYGGCDGIVLMKDMFEEVVGDLENPVGVGSEVLAIGPRLFLAKGAVDLDFLNEELGLELPKDGYETLAGFVMAATEGLPMVGQQIRTPRALLEVLEVHQRTAVAVRIRLL